MAGHLPKVEEAVDTRDTGVVPLLGAVLPEVVLTEVLPEVVGNNEVDHQDMVEDMARTATNRHMDEVVILVHMVVAGAVVAVMGVQVVVVVVVATADMVTNQTMEAMVRNIIHLQTVATTAGAGMAIPILGAEVVVADSVLTDSHTNRFWFDIHRDSPSS